MVQQSIIILAILNKLSDQSSNPETVRFLCVKMMIEFTKKENILIVIFINNTFIWQGTEQLVTFLAEH